MANPSIIKDTLHKETNESTSGNDGGEVLHLKRLLVTLKHQYEKNLQSLNARLQEEENQKLHFQNDLEEIRKSHEEELRAVRQQQVLLRDLLKKGQEEIKLIRESSQNPSEEVVMHQQKIEQLERVIPYLRERTEEANFETEKLREELEEAYKKINLLETEAVQIKLEHEKRIHDLVTVPSIQYDSTQVINLSEQVKGELERIKTALSESTPDNRLLENRYVTIFQEKLVLEQQIKQMQLKLEHQSSNLISFREQFQSTDNTKKHLEVQIHDKEQLLQAANQEIASLKEKLQKMSEEMAEKCDLHERYDFLREEAAELSERLDNALDTRMRAEKQLDHLVELTKEQEATLIEQYNQIADLSRERDYYSNEIQELRTGYEESEGRLKVAQQHLAKKVKEVSLLNEKVEEQQMNVVEHQQRMDIVKVQMVQMQSSIENYQKQEKKLQEQLHDALKSTESQVSKWEEKYFKMYDKWQESENTIKELKKFEEKYHHMQSLLANLGSFMGSSFTSSPLFHAATELEKPSTIAPKDSSHLSDRENAVEEKYDLFGMKSPQEKYKSNPFV